MGLLAAAACQQVSGQDCNVASVQTAVKWNERTVCVCQRDAESFLHYRAGEIQQRGT